MSCSLYDVDTDWLLSESDTDFSMRHCCPNVFDSSYAASPFTLPENSVPIVLKMTVASTLE